MRTRVHDSRLHYWPRVTKGRNELLLSCKVMTPVRLRVVESCVYSPTAFLWKAMVFLLVVDGLMLHFRGMGILRLHGHERIVLYRIMLLPLILWYFETFSRRWLTRIIFGRRLRIRVSEKWIEIGGLWRKHTFARNKPLMFGLHEYSKSDDTVYENSRILCIVIADSRRARLHGIYGRNTSEDVVENANMMLQLHGESRDGDLDIDPSRP